MRWIDYNRLTALKRFEIGQNCAPYGSEKKAVCVKNWISPITREAHTNTALATSEAMKKKTVTEYFYIRCRCGCHSFRYKFYFFLDSGGRRQKDTKIFPRTWSSDDRTNTSARRFAWKLAHFGTVKSQQVWIGEKSAVSHFLFSAFCKSPKYNQLFNTLPCTLAESLMRTHIF